MYIDNLLIVSKISVKYYLKDKDMVLEQLEMEGLKGNSTTSHFSSHKLEYLDYWILQDGIQPLASKVDAIKITKHKNRQYLHSFIVIMNYYRDIWNQ